MNAPRNRRRPRTVHGTATGRAKLLPGTPEAPRDRAGRLARAALEALDYGVVVLDAPLARVSLANREGTRALVALGAPRGLVPAVLAAALHARSASDLRKDRFTSARLLVAPDGRQFYVRGRGLRAPFDGGVLVVTMARMRRSEVVDRIREHTGLSPRLCECVALVRDGQHNHEIADTLGLRPGTVGQYLVDIYARLGVKGRADLVARVEELAHVPPESPRSTHGGAPAARRAKPSRPARRYQLHPV